MTPERTYPTPKTLHILFVDDDEDMRVMARNMLSHLGYRISLAANGAEALTIMAAERPDIAFIDINLPDTWGTELIRDFKKIQPELLCIVITGDPTLDTALDALHQGAEAFFQKPFNMTEVIAKLDSIVEKKNFRDEIKRLNELPRIILDGINEAIVIIDVRDYTIVSANKVFLQETGLTENQVIGKTCFAVTHHRATPCDGVHDICPLLELLQTGNHASAEHIHVDRNGRQSFVEISVSPIRDAAGEVIQVIHTTRDITARKKLEISLQHERKLLRDANAQLEKALSELKQKQSQIVQQEKMASIGQLAAGVAHEINNPMGFIASNLSSLAKYAGKMTRFLALQDKFLAALAGKEELSILCQEREKLKIDFLVEDIPSLIDESLDGANRVKNIVQNLKNFSRVDNNDVAPVNINECLDTTLNIIWNELKYKATVNKHYGELPLVRGSALQLNQVFVNILVNAAQSIEKKGEIRIRTWHKDDAVLVSISDDGCGIAQENISRIFEPFFTTKSVGKGTGLGMSIVYDIIKKHDGDISVQSAVGQGTTFTITLPAPATPRENPPCTSRN